MPGIAVPTSLITPIDLLNVSTSSHAGLGANQTDPWATSSEDAAALDQLRMACGDLYKITLAGNVWRASRLGTGFERTSITTESSACLRSRLYADHRAWAAEARRHR